VTTFSRASDAVSERVTSSDLLGGDGDRTVYCNCTAPLPVVGLVLVVVVVGVGVGVVVACTVYSRVELSRVGSGTNSHNIDELVSSAATIFCNSYTMYDIKQPARCAIDKYISG